jgi:hypothetical protein
MEIVPAPRHAETVSALDISLAKSALAGSIQLNESSLSRALCLSRSLALSHTRAPRAHARTHLVGAIIALIANAYEDAWSHVGVAHRALAIALFAQATNRCSTRRQHSEQAQAINVRCYERSKAEETGADGKRKQGDRYNSACAPMPGCLRHMIRSG